MKKRVNFVMQIRVGIAIIILLMIAIGVIGVLSIKNVSIQKDEIQNNYSAGYRNFLEGSVYFNKAVADSLGIIMADTKEGSDSYAATIEGNLDQMAENFAAAKDLAVDKNITTIVEKTEEMAIEFKDTILTTLSELEADGISIIELPAADRQTMLENSEQMRIQVQARVEEYEEAYTAALNYKQQKADYYQKMAMRIMTLSIVVVVLLSVGIELFIIDKIRLPLRVLSSASKELAVGNVNVHLKKYEQNEFGNLTDDFQSVVDNIRHQADLAGRLAVGDLTVDVNVNGPDDLLGNALNDLVNGNNQMMRNITEASMNVMTGAHEVASASQSLAQGSTEQASAIQQVTASINDIAQRTKVNAEHADEASGIVVDTKDSALRGNLQMKEMMQAMGEINEASDNISRIMKVIDDIAFQTNILALNAAVEAARAGVHGKGFAVVAEEVRNLAGKSAAAASETTELIEDSINKIEKGSKLAAETAEALDEIVEKVEEVVNIIHGIAVAFNEQATAVAQIDQAITQVSTVVQTNSATSEQCAAASEELSNQAAKLKDLVSKYKLKTMVEV